MTAPKILFIGLDAAERNLLMRWSDSGDLPHLRALRERSIQAELEVIPGFGSGAMWPSFATGVSPARHGRYFGHAPDVGYTVRKQAHEIQAAPFWQALSEAGHKVAVIDIPYARPTPNLNGIELLDWAIHNPVAKQPLSTPSALADEMVARYGEDPVGPCDAHGRGQADLAAFRDRLLERVQRKTELAAELLQHDAWDFYAMVFDESHCVGHQAWHLHDPDHPAHDAALAESIGDPVKQVYTAIDAGIGRLIEQAGPDTLVVVAGITGMGPNYSANWLMEDMLRPLEADRKDAKLKALDAVRTAWRKLPQSWRNAIRRQAADFEERNVRAAERSRRLAYALPHNDISGAIRLNVKGREPNGLIEPGAEYAEYLDRIRQHLSKITNAETGEPLVARIIEPRRIMDGEYVGQLPDLLVEWNRNAPIRRVRVPGVGELQNSHSGVRLGDHTTHGLFLAHGPNTQPGKLDQPLSVMDLAPSLCAALGVKLTDVEGRLIPNLAG